MKEMTTGLAKTSAGERTYEADEQRRPSFRLVLDADVERLCEAWADVAKAVLMRRGAKQAKPE